MIIDSLQSYFVILKLFWALFSIDQMNQMALKSGYNFTT